MQQPSAPPARRVGRPRRLTTRQVIEAAIAIGLDNVTMAALAQRLGVRVAVLYNYVKGRDELIDLAARHALTSQPFPDDHGQDWRSYATGYARAAYDLFRSDAQLLPLLMNGKLSPATKVDSVEAWLEAMTVRGFPPTEALALLKAIDAIVMGSAVQAAHARAHAPDYPGTVRAAVTSRPKGDLTRLSAHLDSFVALAEPDAWEGSLHLLLDGIEAMRTAST
ncbi:TetR/AcrR family transcriptional regulator C-terminal domain-containing protein [Sphingobium sp. CAP-1]|uniref:TetR/AcrR family transcriptional regulator C-terminal domain-containing protein n=1 Tax=Sphingobium sp. CAP-1 TaxID=2676077 RepID=UPI0012BB2A1B|nr:TetR/AcrR family transcriptional regulator C-terminal domain-containing protein [Sphingobium sp. CAP-1]QGP81105.1 TetR family transcriptional regulator [Sphingobium sp. CAP-1]